MTDDDQETGRLEGRTTLSIEARGKAVEVVAAGHLGLSSYAPTVLQSDLVRLADLACRAHLLKLRLLSVQKRIQSYH